MEDKKEQDAPKTELDKRPWYDMIEPERDDLYQSREAERLVDANSKREEV